MDVFTSCTPVEETSTEIPTQRDSVARLREVEVFMRKKHVNKSNKKVDPDKSRFKAVDVYVNLQKECPLISEIL